MPACACVSNAYVFVHVCFRMCVHAFILMHVCSSACACVCAHVCVSMCISVWGVSCGLDYHFVSIFFLETMTPTSGVIFSKQWRKICIQCALCGNQE